MAVTNRPPAELASDIGARAFRLMQHDEQAALAAVAFVWHANPEVFEWLRKTLNTVKSVVDPT